MTLETVPLAGGDFLLRTRLPAALRPNSDQFDQLWRVHPADYPEVRIHGRLVKTPRWQAVFGMDYHFSGGKHEAAPTPAEFAPFLDWGRSEIEPRLNGVVVNWYDAELGHYIGRHRDATTNMIAGSPIVMISLGAARTLRLRPWRGRGFRDFSTADGDVYVLPFEANLAWTHEIPLFTKDCGRRISITLRAFEERRHLPDEAALRG